MTNQSAELQKSGAENVSVERFYESRAFDVSLKSLGAFSALATIVTGIAKLAGFFPLLPIAAIAWVSALVFVLTGLALYFVSLRPKYKRQSRENEFLKSEIESLQAELRRRGDVLEKSNQSFARLLEVAQNYESLIKQAAYEEKNIDQYVILERFHYCCIDADPVPVLILIAEIRNNSLFEIILDNEIGGCVEFDQLKIRGQMYFNEFSLDAIGTTESKRMTILIHISKEEKDYIEAFQEKNTVPIEWAFKIDKLILTIKGTVENPRIEPKRLRIRDGFKVINNADYEKALQKFSR